MNTLKLSLAGGAAALAFAGAAQAETAVSFNVGATSDYIFRGVSQTLEDPAVQGGVDVSSGIFYAGAWASNVDFGNGTDAEYDLYVGVKPTLGAATFDFAALRYGYMGSPSGSKQDYWEFKGAVSVPAGPATLGAAVYYSPDFFGGTDEAVYYEVNGAVAIPNTKISLSAALGRQDVSYAGDYTTWNVGAGYAITDNIGVDVRYHDTDEHAFGKIYDSRVVASIKATF